VVFVHAAQVNGIVFAAHDTTGCVLAFALHTLARFPHLQDKVREEVLDLVGEDMVTLDDLAKLVYTQMFIQETMRMYPPVRRTWRVVCGLHYCPTTPLSHNRRSRPDHLFLLHLLPPLPDTGRNTFCMQGPLLGRTLDDNAMIEGKLVPKSQWIEIGVWGLHHNPAVWSEPEVFDPERFSPENKAKQAPFSYLPFSAGSRNCLGQRYAMMEIKVVVASLMQRYYIIRDPKVGREQRSPLVPPLSRIYASTLH